MALAQMGSEAKLSAELVATLVSDMEDDCRGRWKAKQLGGLWATVGWMVYRMVGW